MSEISFRERFINKVKDSVGKDNHYNVIVYKVCDSLKKI